MKRIFTLVIISLSILLTNQSLAQCTMKGEYADLFEIAIYNTEETGKILIKRMAKIDESKCYGRAVNSMPAFFDYLKTNYSDHEVYKEIDLNSDSAGLHSAFKAAVEKDASLQGKLEEYLMRINGDLPKDTFLFSQVLDVAVKFFAIKGITEQGYYEGKVCVGVNLLEATLPERIPFVEAMAFATIMSDLRQRHSSLMNNFQTYMKNLYDLNLGKDENERLLRAQGAMMNMMKNDAQLSGMLAYFYAQHEKSLPFVIK